jgi:rubrerythrin
MHILLLHKSQKGAMTMDIYSDFSQNAAAQNVSSPAMQAGPQMIFSSPAPGDEAAGMPSDPRAGVMPDGAAQSCFGPESRPLAKKLLGYINDEYRDHLYYSSLARRAPDERAKRTLRRMASDELRHARQWSAAYYLITGEKYFPARPRAGEIAVPGSFSGALRERYSDEINSSREYSRFSQSSHDRCLSALAEETAADELRHARKLMGLLMRI